MLVWPAFYGARCGTYGLQVGELIDGLVGLSAVLLHDGCLICGIRTVHLQGISEWEYMTSAASQITSGVGVAW